MKTLLAITLVMLPAIALFSLAEDKVSPTRAERVAADIQNCIPSGWTCTLISEKGKMGHPHGLEEPLFRLDFVNTNLTFREEMASGSERVHPNLRLHFHDAADRDRILKTIEAEQSYSWAIPILFGETKEYVIVTSPLWQNRFIAAKTGNKAWVAGSHTDEANKAVAPLLKALKQYCDAHKGDTLGQRKSTGAELPAEVAQASAAFKTGWQARYPEHYAVSRTLLPWIEKGMTKKEVEGLLGSPDGKSDGRWDYTLFYSMFISVTFGVEGTVTEVSSPLLSESWKAEPDGAANGSQPIRSETNRTSPAAGSRR